MNVPQKLDLEKKNHSRIREGIHECCTNIWFQYNQYAYRQLNESMNVIKKMSKSHENPSAYEWINPRTFYIYLTSWETFIYIYINGWMDGSINGLLIQRSVGTRTSNQSKNNNKWWTRIENREKQNIKWKTVDEKKTNLQKSDSCLPRGKEDLLQKQVNQLFWRNKRCHVYGYE